MQTYLAIYFCFVDVMLVGQYAYYRYTAKPKASIFTRARTTSSATITRRLSLEHPPTHYRALSQVAANVAAAAALAAQQEEQSRWRSHAHHSVESHRSNLEIEDDDVDEDALARLADSFHSERGTARKKVSWSRERAVRGGSLGRSLAPVMSPITRGHPPLLSPNIANGVADDQDFLTRGRPVTRDLPLDDSQTEWAVESSAQRRSSRASRKGAAMVFLSAWALFGVGTLAGGKRGVMSESPIRIGRVLRASVPEPIRNAAAPFADIEAWPEKAPEPASSHPILSYDDLRFMDAPSIRADEPDHHHDGPTTDYIIGRISAWICTTLYLTSRLPQIWKNVRPSKT